MLGSAAGGRGRGALGGLGSGPVRVMWPGAVGPVGTLAGWGPGRFSWRGRVRFGLGPGSVACVGAAWGRGLVGSGCLRGLGERDAGRAVWLGVWVLPPGAVVDVVRPIGGPGSVLWAGGLVWLGRRFPESQVPRISRVPRSGPACPGFRTGVSRVPARPCPRFRTRVSPVPDPRVPRSRPACPRFPTRVSPVPDPRVPLPDPRVQRSRPPSPTPGAPGTGDSRARTGDSRGLAGISLGSLKIECRNWSVDGVPGPVFAGHPNGVADRVFSVHLSPSVP